MPFGTITLNDGNKLPTIAFGTGSKLKRKEVKEYVVQAIESGFHHVDTAPWYYNESDVGEAIKECGLRREELFVTTKYDGGNIQTEIKKSMNALGLTYVDLYLIHDPRLVERDYEGAWREFEKVKRDGLAKSIGVSNFGIAHLEHIMKIAEIKPSVNQIRFHPYNWATNRALLEYHDQHGIVTEGFGILTSIHHSPNGPVDGPVCDAAKRIGASPVQVLFKWARNKGVAIVTTSTSKAHLAEYLAVEDLPPLTTAEVQAIDEAGVRGPPTSKGAGGR